MALPVPYVTRAFSEPVVASNTFFRRGIVDDGALSCGIRMVCIDAVFATDTGALDTTPRATWIVSMMRIDCVKVSVWES